MDAPRATFQSSPLADVGHVDTPASAFPDRGTLSVEVRRTSSVELTWPRSLAVVEVVSTVTVQAR